MIDGNGLSLAIELYFMYGVKIERFCLVLGLLVEE